MGVIGLSPIAHAQLPPLNGYKIQQVGLTGGDYEFAVDGAPFSSNYVDGVNSAGRVIGSTTRFGKFGYYLGEDAWLFNGTTTQLVGLIGSGYQYAADLGGSGGIYRSSYTQSLNESGQVLGFTERFSPSGDSLGYDGWLSYGAATQLLGLVGTGYEYADASGVHRYNVPTQLNVAGQAIGGAVRYSSAGKYLGRDAWLFDGAITQQIGLTGAGYESAEVGGTYRRSQERAMNDAGQVIGDSTRWDAAGAYLGTDAWLFNGIATQRLGLTGSDYSRPPGYGSTAYSSSVSINNQGHVIGVSDRYAYDPWSGFVDSGQDGWLFDGTTTRLIGLIDGDHQRPNIFGYGILRNTTVEKLNGGGQAIGTSTRYSATSSLGQDAWFFDGATTQLIGLTGGGYEHPADGGIHRESYVKSINQTGQVIGITARFNAAGDQLGTAGWFFDPVSGVTTPLDFTSPDMYGFSGTTPRVLTPEGVVLGSYGNYGQERAFWWSAAAGFHDLGSWPLLSELGAAGWQELNYVDAAAGTATRGSPIYIAGLGRRVGQALDFDGEFYSSSAYLLTTLPGLAGDFNGDGRVDAADYVFWRKNDGSATNYNIWRSNFGRTAGSGSQIDADGSAVGVPEPATIAILFIALLGTAGNFRPNKRRSEPHRTLTFQSTSSRERQHELV
jgi:hypothetical protein